MPLIRRSLISLSLEHMTQMTAAVTAHNFGALHTQRAVRVPLHRPRHRVKIRWPAATGLELVRRFVEWGVATRAGVDALRGVVFVEFAREGGFGAFLAEDFELLC